MSGLPVSIAGRGLPVTPIGGGDQLTVTATGSDTGRTLADRFADSVNVLDHIPYVYHAGIRAGTNTTDLRSYIQLALTAGAGGKVVFPYGTYRVDLSTDVALTPAAGTKIEGMGPGTIIEVVVAAGMAVQRRLWQMTNDNVGFADMKITVSSADTGSYVEIWRINTNGENLDIVDVDVDGGMEESGGSANWFTYILSGGSNSAGFSSIGVRGGEWQKAAYGFIVANASTGAFASIQLVGIDLHDFFYETLTFNVPAGTISDVSVVGCLFSAHQGYTISVSQPINLAAASVENFVVVGNNFSGPGLAIQLENNCVGFVISGNNIETANVDDDGIFVTDNDVGHSMTYYRPQRGSISGNTVRGVGKSTSTGVGIYFVWNGTGDAPADNIVCTGNLVSGYEYGISSSDEEESIVIAENVIEACSVGVFSNVGVGNIARNTLVDCDVGLRSSTGGRFGPHDMINVATPFDVLTSGTSLDSERRGGYETVRFHETITLDTGDAETNVGLTPNGVVLHAAIRIATEVVGLDSADHHVQLGVSGTTDRYADASQGSSATTIAVNKKDHYTFDLSIGAETSALILTVTGGSDNTPSAGAVEVEIVYISNSDLPDT